MARSSKLSEKQWSDIERRLLAGESCRSLAREFGISETAIRKRLGSHVKKIVIVADQLLEVDKALRDLPLSSQFSAQNLFQRLRSISDHLASAAEFGAMTSHRLSAMAHTQSDRIDDVDPLKSIETLQTIATLTKIANSSSEIAVNLLSANKDVIREAQKDGGKSQDEFLRELASHLPD